MDSRREDNREYNIAKSIKATNKVGRFFDGYGFVFILVYWGISMFFNDYVHPDLVIPYAIFSLVIGIMFTLKSKYNVGRRIYASIYFYIFKDTATYKPYYDEKGE